MDSTILVWIVVAVAAYLLYVWIDRRRWAGRIRITGNVMLNGGRAIDVESEPDQLRVVERAAARQELGSADGLVATLVAVPTAEGEPAIVVRLGRDIVGRLPRSAEKDYMPVVKRLLEHNKLGDCGASIEVADRPAEGGLAAGGDGQGDPSVLRLRLDLATPDKAIPRGALEDDRPRAM